MSNHGEQDSYTEDVGEDIDEDEILASLSPEELKQLQTEMDVIAPDEEVPVGMRQKDQTDKPPTGSFDHRSLVDYIYWEKESKRMMEEERVPTTLLPSEKSMEEEMEKKAEGNEEASDVVEDVTEEKNKGIEEKKGIHHVRNYLLEEIEEEIKEEEEETQPVKIDAQDCPEVGNTLISNNTENIQQSPLKGLDVQEEKEKDNSEQKDRASELPEEVEPVSLQPSDTAPTETEEKPLDPTTEETKVKADVPEREKVKINKLKIPTLALGGNLIKLTARPSGNETNLDTTLDKIRKNNQDITEVNLNNIENIPKAMLLDYVNTLKKNKHVKTFSIANTGADENVAFALANMLRENRSITTLNIESNFITGKGIVAIMRCLQFNETLTELRFHNQRHMLGHHAEMEVSRLLKANHTLLKMGYHFEQAGPRMVVTNLLTRNLDRQRQLRNEEQKQQQLKEQKEMMEMYLSSLNLPPGLLEMLEGYLPAVSLIPQDPTEPSSEPSPPAEDRTQENHTTQHNSIAPLQPPAVEPGNPLRDVQLRRIPKRRDPFLELNAKEESRGQRANVQLRKVTRQRDAGREESVDERANLKDVIKTLKPVPRRRQPPKVDPTPRDQLLTEIRQSNVAYLKAVPLPKELESPETSLF